MAEAGDEGGVNCSLVSGDTSVFEFVIEGEVLYPAQERIRLSSCESGHEDRESDTFAWEWLPTGIASWSRHKITNDDAALVKQRKEDIRRAFRMMKEAEQVYKKVLNWRDANIRLIVVVTIRAVWIILQKQLNFFTSYSLYVES